MIEIAFEILGQEYLEGRVYRAGHRERSGPETKIWN